MSVIDSERTVSYEDFGAVGDGVTDDFEAIAKAHAYANENALTVVAKCGATYYIGAKLVREIPIKCDVDFCGANFIVDDAVENAFENRLVYLFGIRRDNAVVLSGDALTEAIGGDVEIKRGDKSFPWLRGIISERSYVRVVNEDQRDFVRFGSNQNNGTTRQDVMIVYKDGTIDPSTLPAFEYEKLTKLEIFPEKEPLITIKNIRKTPPLNSSEFCSFRLFLSPFYRLLQSL